LNGSSSVSENTASEHGGGIFNTQGATISYGTGWTGTVSGNIPDDIFSE
jgi:predicted outer membrane repeat protein